MILPWLFKTRWLCYANVYKAPFYSQRRSASITFNAKDIHLVSDESKGYTITVLTKDGYLKLVEDIEGDDDAYSPRHLQLLRHDLVGSALIISKIYTNGTKGRLSFCEVEVFGGERYLTIVHVEMLTCYISF